MVSACLDAAARDRRRALGGARAPRLQLVPRAEPACSSSLYDATTGGCRDGLHADRANENQGAESTLSFLLALLEMRSADRSIGRIGASGT